MRRNPVVCGVYDLAINAMDMPTKLPRNLQHQRTHEHSFLKKPVPRHPLLLSPLQILRDILLLLLLPEQQRDYTPRRVAIYSKTNTNIKPFKPSATVPHTNYLLLSPRIYGPV
jgi:hypothetical protein